MQRIARRVKHDRIAREMLLDFGGRSARGQDITYGTWDNAAGDRLFIRYPDAFGITEQEGHEVRRMFQEGPKDKVLSSLEEWEILPEETTHDSYKTG